jgi:hypothetical protein
MFMIIEIIEELLGWRTFIHRGYQIIWSKGQNNENFTDLSEVDQLQLLMDNTINETSACVYFSNIVTVSFFGGGNRSTLRKPPTCRKWLTKKVFNTNHSLYWELSWRTDLRSLYTTSWLILASRLKHLPFSPSPLRLNIFRLFVILSLTQLYRYTPEIFLFSTATFKYTYRAPLGWIA